MTTSKTKTTSTPKRKPKRKPINNHPMDIIPVEPNKSAEQIASELDAEAKRLASIAMMLRGKAPKK